MAYDPLQAVIPLARGQHGAFSRRQATARSIPPRALRSALAHGRLEAPPGAPGVFVIAGSPATRRQWLAAATLVRAGSCAVGPTALELHDVDIGLPPCDALELSIPAGARLAMPGVRIRRYRMTTNEVQVVDGIACTTVERTVCDMAAILDRTQLEQLLIELEHRGASLVVLDVLAARLRDRAGSHTVRSLVAKRLAVARRSDLWVCELDAALRSHGLRLTQSHPVVDAGGRHVATVRLALVDSKVVIDLWSSDRPIGPMLAARDLRLLEVGWQVVRIDPRRHPVPRFIPALLSVGQALKRAG